MLALRDLQAEFGRALLAPGGDVPPALRGAFKEDDAYAKERFAVYRNNVVASLTEALRDTFPVICRLVDERFFSYAAHEFIAAHPPARPALSEYGGVFAGFLANFPPCRDLVYLPDVARLEWLINVAATAPDKNSLSPAALHGMTPEQAARLGFRLHPSYRYLTSPWPVDRIWLANQQDASDEAVDLDSGGACLEVSRREGAVAFRTLNEAEFVFRRALSEGSSLGEALEHALAVASDFAAGDTLAALFRESAVVAVTRSTSDKECIS
jgi:hypothetical protein